MAATEAGLEDRLKRRAGESRRAVDEYLSEPLSAETRQVGQRLLLIAVFALAVTLGGLVPRQVSALGIEFDAIDQRWLLRLIAVIVSYYLITFSVRAPVDYHRWKSLMDPGLAKWRLESILMLTELEAVTQKRSIEAVVADEIEYLKGAKEKLTEAARRRAIWLRIRALIEYAIPAIAGVAALILLLAWTPSSPR